jgi:hypothetical protein
MTRNRKNESLSQFLRSALQVLVAGLSLGLVLSAGSQDIKPGESELALIVGPESCGECHGDEFQVQQKSRHERGFDELRRSARARDIAKGLGGEMDPTRREDCARCHWTRGLEGGAPVALAGVSCESCHGPAKRWQDLHWKGEGEKLALNLQRSAERGMIRPAETLLLMRRCLDCHLITDESLINKGGHSEGRDFDFPSWLHGEVRHNFLRSKSRGENREPENSRLKQLALMSELAALEELLRRLARETDRGSAGGRRIGNRVLSRYRNLKDWRDKIPELETLKILLASLSLKSASAEELISTADKLATIAQEAASGKFEKSLANPVLDSIMIREHRGKALDFRE